MPIDFWVPKPANDQILEELTRDVMARELGVANLQVYGRPGQKQWGIDCVGRRNNGSLVGVQCKHHPNGVDPKALIAEFIADFDKTTHFEQALGEFWFVTSADRDTHTIDDIRTMVGTSRGIAWRVLFWDDVYSLMVGYPDLVHKYFTRYFPDRDLLNLSRLELLTTPRTQVDWPVSAVQLEHAINDSLGGVPRRSPYSLSLGVTTFPCPVYSGQVDLNVSLADFVDDSIDPPLAFAQAAHRLATVKELIDNTPLLARELVLHPNVRLPYAYLLGWRFRRTTGYRLVVANRDNLWATGGLPEIPPALVESKPTIMESSSNELALVLDIHRDTTGPVIEWANTIGTPQFGVFHLVARNGRIGNAAEAMAIASEVTLRIKSFYDTWGMKRINLFGAVPAALAVMIGHNLNAINGALDLYFLDDDRTTIRHAGTITNNT